MDNNEIKNMEGKSAENPVVVSNTTPQQPNTPTSTPMPEDKKKKNIKLFTLGLVITVVVGIVLTLSIGVYRAYAKADTDPFTVTVAKVLRLPIMKINGERILYSDFADDLKAIHTLASYEKSTGGQNADLTATQMTDQVLWRLANNIIIGDAAKEYNITVESKDLQDLDNQVLSNFKDRAAADAELEKRYGWNLSEYETKVMRPYIIQNKLSDQITNDATQKAVIKSKAQSVLDQIKAGADFAAMAKEYGQDGTAQTGGDLGWFTKGDMVQPFEDAVFALKKGELDPNLVETQYGYHIIQLLDIKNEKSKDGKTTVKSLHARHILFSYPSLNTFLDTATKQADIHLYASLHNPFADLNSPVTATTTTN